MIHLTLNHLRPKLVLLTRTLSTSQRVFSDNKDFRPSEELAKERYDTRADEDLDRKRARLLYQSRKRGMLENGVILSSFADKFLNKLDPVELDQYDRLINLPTNDWDIFYWATKTKPTPAEFETPVMDKLRQHIHSKVSSSENDNVITRGPSILDNKKPDEIVAHQVRKTYQLDLDIQNTDFTNYERELFDTRVKKFNPRESMVYMTEWRKKRFVKRIRRSFSSPISLRHLSDEKTSQVKVYTQSPKEHTIAKKQIDQKDLIESDFEKSMKHHNFMQYLMSSELTDDAQDYDDEAKAWADILWHRNYGSSDVNIAPIQQECKSCHSKLHCCEPGLNGYLPKELLSTWYDPYKSKQINCQRCQFRATYNTNLDLDVSNEHFIQVMSQLKTKPASVVCIMVDLTDFPGGIYEGLIDLIGVHHKIIILGNKIDLLPYDKPNMIDRVIDSLRKNISRLRLTDKNLFIDDILPISARTGFGVEGLVTRILSYCIEPKDVFLVGAANSGKSTLYSSLLQTDLCAIRDVDLISRISKVELANNINMLRFPVDLPEGWEVELKKNKCNRVERDTTARERSLQNTTLFRQADTPHVALLIDRLDFPQLTGETSLIPSDNSWNNRRPSFTEDHPLRNVKDSPPLMATPENFANNSFCYQLPSTKTVHQLHDLFTLDEKLEIFPHETIKPRKYSLRPMQTIFIAGLARLDLVTSTSNVIITIFASRYLPVHVVATKKADHFYRTFIGSTYLGVPFGGEERMKSWPKHLETTKEAEYLIRGSEYQDGLADVVFSSIGWALVSVCKDKECIVRAFTPEARGIYCRRPPLIEFGRESVVGKKIRDTPLFLNSNYRINSIST